MFAKEPSYPKKPNKNKPIEPIILHFIKVGGVRRLVSNVMEKNRIAIQINLRTISITNNIQTGDTIGNRNGSRTLITIEQPCRFG